MNHVRSQPALDEAGNPLRDGNGQIVWEQVEISTPWTANSLIDEIKSLRDYHWNKGALLHDGGRLQSDVESRANLTGAIAAGNELSAAGQPFSIQWSLGAGQFLSLDLPTLKQLGLLQFQHIQAAQNRYGTLRGMISETSTTEQLDAVAAIMHEGWPP